MFLVLALNVPLNAMVASRRRGSLSDLWPEVVGSSLSQALRRKNSGQVSHTYVPLSPSSITWYQRKLGS